MLIVVDGAVDLPDALEGSVSIRAVPGAVWNGDVAFEGDVAELWAQLRRGRYPSTTPPTVSDLMAAYRHPDLVVAVHVSGRLSAVLARAREAAARVATGVVIVDTRSLSVGAGLVATALHRAPRSAGAPSSPVDLARSLPGRLHTFALVQDVEALRRSDHAGLLPTSHLARHQPLVLAVRGRAVALSQHRHRSDAVDELARHLLRSTGGEVGGWALGHGDAADVGVVVDRLSAALARPPAYCTTLDATVGAHLGPESLVVGAITGPVDLGQEG